MCKLIHIQNSLKLKCLTGQKFKPLASNDISDVLNSFMDKFRMPEKSSVVEPLDCSDFSLLPPLLIFLWGVSFPSPFSFEGDHVACLNEAQQHNGYPLPDFCPQINLIRSQLECD